MAKFQIKGLDQVLKKLDKLPEAVAKKLLKEGMMPSAELLRSEVERQAPVDEGTLKSAVIVKPAKSKGGKVGVIVQIGAGDFRGKTFYAAAINYGTEKMPANPFMRRAFEARAAEALDLAITNIEKLIDKEANA